MDMGQCCSPGLKAQGRDTGQNTHADPVSIYQNLPFFFPHPSLPAPFPRGFISSMPLAGCRHPPNSKAELRVPQNRMQPPHAPGSISTSEEGLWHQELPPGRFGAGHPTLCTRWRADDRNPLPKPPRRLHGPRHSDSDALRGRRATSPGDQRLVILLGPSSAGPGGRRV